MAGAWQVKCSRESPDALSVPTVRAEVHLVRVLSALCSLVWWPSASGGSGYGTSVEVPSGMAFDTNFYPGGIGVFSNGMLFGLDCGESHNQLDQLTFAI